MPVAPVRIYTLSGLQPFIRPQDAVSQAFRLQPNLVNLPAGAVLDERTTASASTIWSIAGTPAGNWTLSFRGHTTAALSSTITAADLRTALNLLPSINGAISAASGGAIGTAAVLLTLGGGSFANSPIELPTSNVAMTIGIDTQGGTAGQYGPAATNSTTCRVLNKYTLSTDGAGNITFADSAVAAEWDITRKTAPGYIAGYFDIRDIPQAAITGITGGYLTATTLAALGKMLNGGLTPGKGVLHLGV
jgi:hypothetical protein